MQHRYRDKQIDPWIRIEKAEQTHPGTYMGYGRSLVIDSCRSTNNTWKDRYPYGEKIKLDCYCIPYAMPKKSITGRDHRPKTERKTKEN